MSDRAYDVSLPPGIRSRFVSNGNGLLVHLLEAGYEQPDRPLALLLHGFPELAWSWRKLMPALAAAGWHVIAPDQRGYGRTIGWDADFDGDMAPFRLLNLVRDTVGLVFALGRRRVDALVGHDFGAIVAPWCALLRPDVFRSVTLMSAPFAGPPTIPFATDGKPLAAEPADIHRAMAALPRPRKHYQWYYSTREADGDMRHCPQGVHDFLRAYFYVKSADWPANRPFPLQAWEAEELAKLPTYYIMDLDQGMAQTVVKEMPSDEYIAACRWLPDEDLHVYSSEFGRIGFQGGLNWYRARIRGRFTEELQIFDGCRIEVPSCFIAGASDWGVHQTPGAFESMQTRACSNMLACHLVAGAGHWVQQEQPEAVSRLLLAFLDRAGVGPAREAERSPL